LAKQTSRALNSRTDSRAAVPGTRSRRRAIFTIASTNYISYAATLMRSAQTYMPGVARFIVLADSRRTFDDVESCATLLNCDDLCIEQIENMKAWYTVIEFNTAIKPFAFTHFFERLAFDEVCYIDPDILLFSPMTEVFEALRDHSCVLTPHIMQPLQDGREPSDLTIMKSGIYNLGFLGLRNDEDGKRLAKWWSDRCFLHCRVDIAGNLFTDQRWMDLAPAFVERPFILRHPGYNIAYWNLAHRAVTRTSGGKWRVNGERLVFFHFSGIAIDKPGQFSKHQNRFTSDNIGIVNELCDLYRSLVMQNGWQHYAGTPYGFGFFADGRAIDAVMRHSIVRAVDEGRLDPRKKLVFSSDYFDRPAIAAAEKGVFVTRYMYQLWLDRRDLRAAFDIFTPEGLQGYFNWFLGGDAQAQGVDDRSLSAARELQRGEPPPSAALPPMQFPPWPRVCLEVWSETSEAALSGLAHDLTVSFAGFTIRIPKQIALLWERRRDLQSAFDLTVPERLRDYLSWALTNGVRDGVVDISGLSKEFVQNFLKMSSISTYYGDVPVTEGMIMLRQVGEAREFVPGWQRFPVERSGRVAHGMWFAFIAPKLYGWPDEFVAPVRQYFLEPTETGTDHFRLNRAAIAVWELRADLQRTFPLGDRLSIWRYLRWLLVDGLRELGLTIDEFDPRLRAFLLGASPRHPGVTQMLEMLHDYRPDLSRAFDINNHDDRARLVAWAEQNIRPATAALSLGEALRDSAPDRALHGDIRVHRTSLALTGYWAAPSGRGEDLRGSVHALNEIGFSDYVVIDLEHRLIMGPGEVVMQAGTRIEADINLVHTNADTAAEDARVLRHLGVAARKSIGFWAWELEWLPDYWRHAYSYYDEIWAATRYAEAAFNRDAVRPVKYVRMSVREPQINIDIPRASLGLPEEATLFVLMFDFRSYAARKNPEAVIRAFLSAFPDGDESVHLLIKTSGATAMPADAARLRELAQDRRIELRDALLDRHRLLGLIRAADAFVSLHRAEGFGRGPAEAMLLGVPVIVTDYSGSSDYATADNTLLVDYEFKNVLDTEYPGVTGQRWADANVRTAAQHMRWVHENPEAARAMGKRGREHIRHLYNARTIGLAMVRALGLHHTDGDAATAREGLNPVAMGG
jgi:glycosyltransferase involved in cell wall biosynthesis